MPGIEFETPDDTPLFPDDDPLTLTIPGGGTYRCLDRANPPLEDDVNPETKPLAYIIRMLRDQLVEEDRERFEEEITDLVRENRIMVRSLGKVAKALNDARKEAEKRATSGAAARPTRARRRSTP